MSCLSAISERRPPPPRPPPPRPPPPRKPPPPPAPKPPPPRLPMLPRPRAPCRPEALPPPTPQRPIRRRVHVPKAVERHVVLLMAVARRAARPMGVALHWGVHPMAVVPRWAVAPGAGPRLDGWRPDRHRGAVPGCRRGLGSPFGSTRPLAFGCCRTDFAHCRYCISRRGDVRGGAASCYRSGD